MHIERIHKMIEKLTECALCEIEKGIENVNTEEMGEVVDMIKDLSEAEYKSLISKEMKKCKEEDEAEEKYFLKMLKEEKQDEYKRMKEEYGEDEGERRFYDNYRYANGRFAPKGSGTYRPRSSGKRGRRGYEEMIMPVDYMVPPEMRDPEWYRDMDRKDMQRMYYSGGNGSSGGSTGGNSGGQSGGMSGGNMGGSNSGGSSRGYSEGYDDGSRRGYESGYSDGQRDGRRNNSGSQSRYDKAKRGYTETKMSDDGTPESKKKAMESLDKYMKELADDMTELVGNMDNSEKTMLRSKLQTLAQKVQ